MDITKAIKEALELPNSHRKENALESINEVLEYGHGEILERDELIQGVKLLLAAALQEEDSDMKRRLLRTISQAVVFHQGKYLRRSSVDWDPLASSVASLEIPQLEYALLILGVSGREKYVPVLERYTQHTGPRISKLALKAIDDIKLFDAYDARNEE